MEWNKEKFKEEFLSSLQAEEGNVHAENSVKPVYNALCKVIRKYLFNDWKDSRKAHQKRCGYFSAEFLIGRVIFSNLLNLGILKEVRESLGELGINLYDMEEVEDAALGNGGLGRLAACFLDSAATLNVPLDGYGLRYRYGLFKQKFENGFQKEAGDDWLAFGDPWSRRLDGEKVLVRFADFSVYAVPYDMPIIGYQNSVVNTLRLWQSEPVEPFDFYAFDKMEGKQTAIENFNATSITDVLYPNDNTDEGKILRLRQQYLLVSASLQDFLKKFEKEGGNMEKLYEKQIFQLNDTHPVLAIPELIRLLEERGVPFNEAFEIAQKTFRFTNHTIMGEALEKWRVDMLKGIIPEVLDVIERLQKRLESEGLDAQKYYIVKDGMAHMANLAVYVCQKVNGVAKMHTDILKADTFKDWYDLYPEKFVNVTNGITPRRWFILNNPKMAMAVTKRIGDSWVKDLTELQKLKPYIKDETFRKEFITIKGENKKRLAEYIRRKEGIELPPDFIFDTQIKRLHEYKRQLLNAFSILYIYKKLKKGELTDFKNTAFIFGAKSAPGYYNAKAIIKYINEIGKLVNSDSEISQKMKVVFVQNYNVSYAEKIVCASDISEQISMAGMEASGTGNMKFMLNGTVTLGTMDGANVEICQEAGCENNYIFGAKAEEIGCIKKSYNPKAFLEQNPDLKEVVETLIDGSLSDSGTGMFQNLYHSLISENEGDRYLLIYDFADYIRAKLKCIADYGSEEFTTKCLFNMASAGKFSSDRSIRDYCNRVWEIPFLTE